MCCHCCILIQGYLPYCGYLTPLLLHGCIQLDVVWRNPNVYYAETSILQRIFYKEIVFLLVGLGWVVECFVTSHWCFLHMFSGLPIPIVAVSAAVSHEQYGINDMYVCNYRVKCNLCLIKDATEIHNFL